MDTPTETAETVTNENTDVASAPVLSEGSSELLKSTDQPQDTAEQINAQSTDADGTKRETLSETISGEADLEEQSNVPSAGAADDAQQESADVSARSTELDSSSIVQSDNPSIRKSQSKIGSTYSVGAASRKQSTSQVNATTSDVQSENRPSEIEESGTENIAAGFSSQSLASTRPPSATKFSRQISSPPPYNVGTFTFLNVDPSKDTENDQWDIQLRDNDSDNISRSSSTASQLQLASKGKSADPPYMRPTSPTAIAAARKLFESDSAYDETSKHADLLRSTANDDENDLPVDIDREALIEQLRIAMEQKEKIRIRNQLLQSKLAEHFKKRRPEENRETEKSIQDQESRYNACLAQLADLYQEYDVLNKKNEAVVDDLRAKLAEKQKEEKERNDEFIKYKRQAALSSENSRTGKSLSSKVVDQLEQTEQKKEQEVFAVRLENIKLRNRLKRHEQLLRQKEELAEGLHLIDFEQLKIENQTFNEKIEERNEELTKLRKKITTIVQILSHVKEKLVFVLSENDKLRSTLAEIDSQVFEKRNKLPAYKRERDKLKIKSNELKQRNGLLGNTQLLQDFEEKMNLSEELQKKLEQLKAYHSDLSEQCVIYKRKIHKAHTDDKQLYQMTQDRIKITA